MEATGREFTEIEKAQQLIAQERQARTTQFQAELQALCEKYQCSLQVRPSEIIIQAL